MMVRIAWLEGRVWFSKEIDPARLGGFVCKLRREKKEYRYQWNSAIVYRSLYFKGTQDGALQDCEQGNTLRG